MRFSKKTRPTIAGTEEIHVATGKKSLYIISKPFFGTDRDMYQLEVMPLKGEGNFFNSGSVKNIKTLAEAKKRAKAMNALVK